MKRMKAVLAGLLAILLLAGCAGSGLKGTWKLESMEQDGVLVEGTELEAVYGGSIEYVFEADGKITVKMMGQEAEGTWEEADDVVTVTYNGLTSELKKDGKELILEKNGVTYRIVKQ